MITALLLALTALPQEPAGSVRPFEPDQAITPGVLEEEIDRSLHWLRGRFDPATGSFGGVDQDAWALLAFAVSPRQYRPGDGPFIDRPLANVLAAQAEDGSFGEAPRCKRIVDALAALGAAPEARAKAEPHAAGAPLRNPVVRDAKDAVRRARNILELRNPNGSYGSGALTIAATASNIEYLTDCHRVLKAGEEPRAKRDAQALPGFSAAQAAEVAQALERGAEFLLAQRVDGGWGFDGRRDAGITAMATGALLALAEPRRPEVQAAIVENLDWLGALQHDDGSIHEGQLANYVTSAAVLALVRGGREADAPRVERAAAFLKGLQADEGEGYSEGDRYYGGVGYGGDERPDLSNLQMALEALHVAGTSPEDPVFQKALAFLQRCQNRSESNDLALVVEGKTVAAGNDGGAGYAPGESKAGFVELPDGTRIPRSYGSMSYALLKGYLFAGLSKEDPRVQALWKWLRENYTLDVNPGFQASDDPTAAYQGLFYYFYTMAKALDLLGEPMITDAAGKEHDWRGELAGRLVAMQRQDGSWVNDNAPRWFEGNPVLATSYALLTLGEARGSRR
jgi:squalene-hopene/tetraprenyl-beta-curcumene cyclase